jgi:hypothetical protein
MCKHLLKSDICHICNMYTFLMDQKRKCLCLSKDINKLIFEKIKPWEITLYIIVDEITRIQSINLEKDEEDEISTRVDVKFYGDYESFIGFQAWTWLALSYGPSTEILRERNKPADNMLILKGMNVNVYSLISTNYPAFISGVVEAMSLSNIWTLRFQLKNIYTVSPVIVKFCNVRRTAIEQLTAERGDDFDGHDISKLKKRLKENNRTKLTPEYIDQARLDYPCKLVY